MFSLWWLQFSQKCNHIFFRNVLYHWRGSQRASEQVFCCHKSQSSKRKCHMYTFFWWCGALKNSLCYVAWSLALFNSTYAKSTHHFLLLFTMSCRKLCDTYRISLMLNNLLMEGEKMFTFLALAKQPCLYINAETSHNALGYPYAKWPFLSPHGWATLVVLWCVSTCYE